MKRKYSLLIFFLLAIFIFYSCLNSTETTVSSSAVFKSLTFAYNSKNKKLSTAVFSLQRDEHGDTIIVNVDSLPYNTKIDSVVPTFTFASSYKKTLIQADNTNNTIVLNGNNKDTINFNKRWFIENVATDQKTTKKYLIKVNVHKVEPELYVYSQLESDILPFKNALYQKAIALGDTIYFYASNDGEAKGYFSTNGTTWSEMSLINFPKGLPLTDMQYFNGKLYLGRGGATIYSSSDKRNWKAEPSPVTNYDFSSLLYIFQNKLWAVVSSQSNPNDCRFAWTSDGDSWTLGGDEYKLQEGFPVKDFTSVTFNNSVGFPRVLVIGGKTANNTLLKTRWSSEDGKYWLEYSQYNHTLDTLSAGSTVISYDRKLILFGKQPAKKGGQDSIFLKKSIDEGLTWVRFDTLYNRMRQVIIIGTDTTYINYKARNYISAVVLRPQNFSGAYSTIYSKVLQDANQIFLIGGFIGTEAQSDVWRCKLNRLSFLKQ